MTIRVFLLLCCLSFTVHSQPSADSTELNAEFAAYKQYAADSDWITALEHARKAYELGKTVYQGKGKEFAALAYNYGRVLLELRNLKDAEPVLTEALELLEDAHGNDALELLPALMDLGAIKALSLNSNYIKLYIRAANISKKHFGSDSIEYAQKSLDIGIDILSKARSFEAKKYIYDAYRIYSKKLEKNDPLVAYAAFWVGKIELSGNKAKTAIEYLNQTLASFKDPERPSSPLELSTHGFLVHAYESLKQHDLATRHALAIGRMTPADDTQDIQPIFRIEPELSPAVRRTINEGHVLVQHDIDTNGHVLNVEVLEYSGSKAFIDAALEAVKQWRYAPRFIDGSPVEIKGHKTRLAYRIMHGTPRN